MKIATALAGSSYQQKSQCELLAMFATDGVGSTAAKAPLSIAYIATAEGHAGSLASAARAKAI